MTPFALMQRYDSDAMNYLEAAGITDDAVIKPAVHTLFKGFKAQGLWPLLPAFYPFAGGTALSTSINGKSPGTYKITWAGGVTHSANGTQGDGTTGYGDTGLIPSTAAGMTLNGAGVSFYNRTTTPAGSGGDIGNVATNSIKIQISAPAGRYAEVNANSGIYQGSGLQNQGFHHVTRTASTVTTLYFNGSSSATDASASVGLPTSSIYVLGLNPLSTGYYSYMQCAFAAVDTGMTSVQAGALYTLIQAFQTSLSRQV